MLLHLVRGAELREAVRDAARDGFATIEDSVRAHIEDLASVWLGPGGHARAKQVHCGSASVVVRELHGVKTFVSFDKCNTVLNPKLCLIFFRLACSAQ